MHTGPRLLFDAKTLLFGVDSRKRLPIIPPPLRRYVKKIGRHVLRRASHFAQLELGAEVDIDIRASEARSSHGERDGPQHVVEFIHPGADICAWIK